MTLSSSGRPEGIHEFRLDGQVAIVTGGSRSLGRATAIALADAGADVVVSGRAAEDVERVAQEVADRGRRSLPIVCDVTDSDAVEAMVARTRAELGRLDVMVANAGIFQTWGPADGVTLDEYDSVMATNLKGVWVCCHAAGRAMIEQGGGGSIVAVSSIASEVAIPNTAAYTAAKHGVVGLIRALATDWGEHGIRVNAVAPGFTAREPEPLLDDPEFLETLRRRCSLARFGTGREVALACVFLASPAASFITGVNLAVDGGWVAR